MAVGAVLTVPIEALVVGAGEGGGLATTVVVVEAVAAFAVRPVGVVVLDGQEVAMIPLWLLWCGSRSRSGLWPMSWSGGWARSVSVLRSQSRSGPWMASVARRSS